MLLRRVFLVKLFRPDFVQVELAEDLRAWVRDDVDHQVTFDLVRIDVVEGEEGLVAHVLDLNRFARGFAKQVEFHLRRQWKGRYDVDRKGTRNETDPVEDNSKT